MPRWPPIASIDAQVRYGIFAAQNSNILFWYVVNVNQLTTVLDAVYAPPCIPPSQTRWTCPAVQHILHSIMWTCSGWMGFSFSLHPFFPYF